jgi:hypothetical protein
MAFVAAKTIAGTITVLTTAETADTAMPSTVTAQSMAAATAIATPTARVIAAVMKKVTAATSLEFKFHVAP